MAVFAHRITQEFGLRSPAMTQKFTIPSGNKSFGIPQQGHNCKAVRRHLPVITAHGAQTKENLRDFEQGRTAPASIMGLQHTAVSTPLLTGQPGIWGNPPAMQARKKPVNCNNTVKSIRSKRNNCTLRC